MYITQKEVIILNPKTIKCTDFGMECPFSITDEDGQEAIDLAMMHVQKKHAEKLTSLSEEEKAKMMEKMKAMVA